MSSCILFGYNNDYVTKSDVQQMINGSMNGNVTVEGGDNYNVTISGVSQDHAAAGKALLSAVSIRCVFQTTSYGTSFQPGHFASASDSFPSPSTSSPSHSLSGWQNPSSMSWRRIWNQAL